MVYTFRPVEGAWFPASWMVLEMDASTSVMPETLIVVPLLKAPNLTLASKAVRTIFLSMSGTSVRKESMRQREAYFFQCVQYLMRSLAVLAMTPWVTARHADMISLTTPDLSVSGTLSKISSVEEESGD